MLQLLAQTIRHHFRPVSKEIASERLASNVRRFMACDDMDADPRIASSEVSAPEYNFYISIPEAQRAKPKKVLTHPPREGLTLLRLKGKCVVDDAGLTHNCRIAKEKAAEYGFHILVNGQWPPYDMPVVIVASGRSVESFVNEIKEKQQSGMAVMAVKGAHDWLIERGIVPEFAVMADPQKDRAKCFRLLNDRTVYLPASQCDPDTWEHLRGRRVVLWHPAFSVQQIQSAEWSGVPVVAGGCTTGLRAMQLAYLMGWRIEHLYGFDSSVQADNSIKITGDVVSDEKIIEVEVGLNRLDSERLGLPHEGRKFLTTASLAKQSSELVVCLPMMPGVSVEAFGDGLFQYTLNRGRLAGWPI